MTQVARFLHHRGEPTKAVVDDEPALFLLAVELSFAAGLKTDGQELCNRIVRTLSLPGETWVISLKDNPKFRKSLRAVQDSQIYSRV